MKVIIEKKDEHCIACMKPNSSFDILVKFNNDNGSVIPLCKECMKTLALSIFTTIQAEDEVEYMDCEYEDENIHLKSIEGNVYKVNEDESLTLLVEKTNIPNFAYITQDEKSILFKINGKFAKYLKFGDMLILNNDLVLEHEDKGEQV